MFFSIEMQNKINVLFEDDVETRDRLLAGDADAIRELVKKFQDGISPEYVVDTFESGDQDAMNSLYKQGKKLLELKNLYRELCLEFYEKEENIKALSQTNCQERKI